MGEEPPPELSLTVPNTRPLADPANALTPELAAMVSSGNKMKPEEALFLTYDKTDEETADSSDYLSDSEDDSEYGSDDEDDDYSFLGDGEMDDILNNMPLVRPSTAAC